MTTKWDSRKATADRYGFYFDRFCWASKAHRVSVHRNDVSGDHFLCGIGVHRLDITTDGLTFIGAMKLANEIGPTL